LSQVDDLISKAENVKLGIQDKVIKINNLIQKSGSTKTSGDDGKLTIRNGRYFAQWTGPCEKFMLKYDLMPAKLSYKQCYREFR